VQINPSLGPRFIRIKGHDVDTRFCTQRFCPVRGCYVIQNVRDPFFLLETPNRVMALEFRGTEPEHLFLSAVNEARTTDASQTKPPPDSPTRRLGG